MAAILIQIAAIAKNETRAMDGKIVRQGKGIFHLAITIGR